MIRGLIATSTLLISAHCMGAEIINLECRGSVTHDTDGKKNVMEKTVDVALNTDANMIKISGYWGCLADIGDMSGGQCSMSPYKANQTEVEVTGKSDGEKYQGTMTMTLNRYSGRLRATSVAFAKPAANAQWTVMMVNTEMLCSAKNKLF